MNDLYDILHLFHPFSYPHISLSLSHPTHLGGRLHLEPHRQQRLPQRRQRGQQEQQRQGPKARPPQPALLAGEAQQRRRHHGGQGQVIHEDQGMNVPARNLGLWYWDILGLCILGKL